MDNPVFNSELAKKFLEKIETMSFKELDERASRASSIGIEGILKNLPILESTMINYTNCRIITLQDWDELVQETYNKPYSFQQQDDCKDRGIVYISVPAKEEDYENNTISETDYDYEMGVSFKAWLKRDPSLKIPYEDSSRLDFTQLWWKRNFYPHVSMIINDLYFKGLLESGEYGINIDW